MTTMPMYQCHKRVWALKIKSVITDPAPDWGGITLEFEDPGFGPRAFRPADLANRPKPEPGMYMVEYENAYISFSPGDVFEAGYHRVEASQV